MQNQTSEIDREDTFIFSSFLVACDSGAHRHTFPSRTIGYYSLQKFSDDKNRKNSGMGPSFILALVICSSIPIVTGIFTNVFIVVVNVQEWRSAQRLPLADIILVTLGVSNILLQCTLAVYTLLALMWQKILYLENVYQVIFLLRKYTIFSSFWLTAWLCVFYCLKIVNTSHQFFVWIKLRLSIVVPWVLLATFLGTLVLCVPIYWNVECVGSHNVTANLTLNATIDMCTFRWSMSYIINSSILGCCLPILLVALSVTLILSSLYRHTRRMKKNMCDNSNPRLDAHIRAAAVMTGLFVLCASFYLAEVSALSLQFQDTALWEVVSWAIISLFPLGQSVLLILGNSLLRGVLWKILGLSSIEGTH